MDDLTQQDQIKIIQNQIHQWKISQFDAIIARRVHIKLGEPTTQVDAVILRTEKALAYLEEELAELGKNNAAPLSEQQKTEHLPT